MKQKFILTIRAGYRPGLLHLITGVIERKLVLIENLNMVRKSNNGDVLVTLEVRCSEKTLAELNFKLKNIIEVIGVESVLKDQSVILGTAFFALHKDFLRSGAAGSIKTLNAEIIGMTNGFVLVAKCGREAEIKNFYDAVKGDFLLGFSQSAPILASELMLDEERIIGLAA